MVLVVVRPYVHRIAIIDKHTSACESKQISPPKRVSVRTQCEWAWYVVRPYVHIYSDKHTSVCEAKKISPPNLSDGGSLHSPIINFKAKHRISGLSSSTRFAAAV